MKTHSALIYIFLLFTYLLTSVATAADIRVIADRTHIELNETFTLIFESNESVDDDPDFSPLERDFKILSQGKSSNISIINGQYTRSSQWKLSLMPMRVGTLNIPPVSFGKDKSPKHQITISPVQKSTGKKGEAFISELTVSTRSAHLQSQIIVTQRMLSSRNINGYEFSELTISGVDAAIEPLGKLKQYQTKRGLTPYLVLEQRYAVYPQTTGTLVIEPSLASAHVTLNNRSSYDPFRSNTKTVRRSSEKKSIEIENIPKSFKGKHWLPAIEVQLVEEFPENQNFKVGEPITRTLSLLADGQSASQLPDITMAEIDNLKQYPDKPVLNDNKRDDGITGVQQIKFALIPSQAGQYTLPAISIPWWNTRTHKMQVAKIAARTFSVGPASNSASTLPLRPQQATTAPPIENRGQNTGNNTVINAPTAATEHSPDSGGGLVWKIISLLLACAWAVTLFLLWQLKRNSRLSEASTHPAQTSLKQANKQLKAACDKEDAQACKIALLSWGSALFDKQKIHSLGKLSEQVNQPLADKLNDLNAYLYKGGSIDWKCEKLIDLCLEFEQTFIKQGSSQHKDEQLETLYR